MDATDSGLFVSPKYGYFVVGLFNRHRTHSGLEGRLPEPCEPRATLNFAAYRWQQQSTVADFIKRPLLRDFRNLPPTGLFCRCFGSPQVKVLPQPLAACSTAHGANPHYRANPNTIK